VDVKTHEEDEIVVFKMRAKLFVFVKEDVYGGEKRTDFWKERGTGDVKLLRHREMGKIRLLMRQEKTLKICANHLVAPTVEITENVGSDRSWVFTAADFADEELKTETFAIKFGNSDKAKKFKESVELAKKINGGEADPSLAVAIADDDEDEKKEDTKKEEGEKKEEKKEEKKDEEVDKAAEELSKAKIEGSEDA